MTGWREKSSSPARFPDSATPPRYCSASPALHLFAALTGLPPRAEPTAPCSAAWAVAWRALTGPAREALLDNRVTKPDRETPRAPGTMYQQSIFDLGDYSTETGLTMAVGEQPPNRLEHYGVNAASDTELLAMILHGNGVKVAEAVSLASRLVAEAGSLPGLVSWTADDYRKTKGIGRIKGLQLAAIAEIARRMMGPRKAEAPLLDRPEMIAAHLAPTVAGLQTEKFFVLCLNRKHRLIKQVELTSGTASSTLVSSAEVIRAALSIQGGVTTALACAHNHPTGVCIPSMADNDITRQLKAACKAVDLSFLDHLILGRAEANTTGKNYYSFAEASML